MEINFDSITFDDKGRVSFSGLGSGIDFVGAVDAIMAARRLPIDRLEATIETNDAKIVAYQELRNLLNALSDALDTLRGSPSVGDANDIFAAKEAFATVSRTDGTTPSAGNNLIGVTLTNEAVIGSHDIEMLQIARAHKFTSNAYTSTTTAIGFADGDQFTIEGTVITLTSTDTLLTLRDRINSANSGTSATEVSASIISVSTTENYLVVTNDQTGADVSISDTTNTPLQTVGIFNGSSAFLHELQASQSAQFYADGLIDETNKLYESDRQSASTNTLGSSGNLTFDDGSTNYAFAYDTADTIQQLADNITADGTLQAKGISASVVTEGGQVRLKIETTGDAFTITDSGSVKTSLGISNARLEISRTTNTVDDLYAGVTLSLFQPEVGTNILIEIAQDLITVKSQVTDFVDAYNAVKVILNTHGSIDETTNKVSEDAILFGERTIAEIQNELSQIFVTAAQGVDQNYSVLAQIGITFVNNSAISDPLLADTLEINVSKLDSALLSNPADVKRMFTFDFTSSTPDIVLLSFTGKTSYAAAGYVLNIAYNDLFTSDAVTDSGSFTQLDAETGGPATDGISAIAFGDPLITNQAFRYSYSGSSLEELTLVNITTGATQTVDITSLLDTATGAGEDLAAGETVAVSFSSLNVTITLSGDNGFIRATAISDGTLDETGLSASNIAITTGAVATPTSGSTFDSDTIQALINLGVYDAATGLLTIGITSATGVGDVVLDAISGIKYKVDSDGILGDNTATGNLDDSGAHSVGIYVIDGGDDVLVATLSFDTIAASDTGSGSVTIDLGTGLLGETSTVVSSTSPMENYLTAPTLTAGQFDISNSSTTLGTITYATTDSLSAIVTSISAISGLSASIVSASGTFYISVTEDDSNDVLTFDGDTGNLLSHLNMTDTGSTIISANIGGDADGSDDGTVTVSGNVMTVTDTSTAEDLKILYTGSADISGITLDYTVGFAATMFAALDKILRPTTGSIETSIDVFIDLNEFSEERVDQMLRRLEQQRQSLLDRFIRMELALLSMNRILDTMKQTFDSLTASRR